MDRAMKPNSLPYRRALGAATVLCALLLLGPGLAEAKGRKFVSSGGGYHGSQFKGGNVGGKRRGSPSLRGGKKTFVTTKFRNRNRRRSNIIIHRNTGNIDLLDRLVEDANLVQGTSPGREVGHFGY